MSALFPAILTSVATNSRATGILDEQVKAINLARIHIETIKSCPYADTYPNANCLLNDIDIPLQYTVVIDTDCSTDGTTWLDTCAGESLQKITASVSREGEQIHSLTTYRAKQ